MRQAAGYAWTDYKHIERLQMNTKYNPSFGQSTGLQKNLDVARKQKVSSQITHSYKRSDRLCGLVVRVSGYR